MGKRNTTGTSADGTSNAFAHPGEVTLTPHHSPGAARASDHLHGDNSIARAGKPKRLADVSVHNAMTDRQRGGVNVGGMGHGVAINSGGEIIGTSSAAAPLPHAYGTLPKVRGPAPVKEGMKNRCGPVARSLIDATPHDIRGKMLLDEAS